MVALIGGWIDAGSSPPKSLEKNAEVFARSLVADPARAASALVETKAVGSAVLACVLVPSRPGREPPQRKLFAEYGAITVAADARLTNRHALLQMLRESGPQHRFSDPELIARLYLEQGEEGLNLLRGEFAFALHDANNDLLLLRRDHFGTRPLFHAVTADKPLIFASLARAFTESDILERCRNWPVSFDYLAGNAHHGNGTMIEGLRKVPAACQFTWSRDGLSREQYWKLSPPPMPAGKVGFEVWCDGLKRRFEQAVATRLPLSGVVASELSGGLDAGGITAMAAKMLPSDAQHVEAFCAAISEHADPELFIDETDQAKEIAQTSNRIALTTVPYRRPHPGVILELEPDRTEGGYALREDDTCRAAAAQGAEVILCGWGGDQAVTFNGSGVFADALRRGRLLMVANEFGQQARENGRWQAFRWLGLTVFSAVAPKGSHERLMRWRRGDASRNSVRTAASGLRSTYRGSAPSRHKHGGHVVQSMIEGLNQIARSGRLDSLAATSARHGVQYSLPMLDVELVEYMLGCPPEFIADRQTRRKPFRHIMQGLLPDSVRLSRRKALPAPELLAEMCSKRDADLEQLELLAEDKRLHQFVDFAQVRSQLAKLPDYDEVREFLAREKRAGRQGRLRAGNKSYRAVANISLLQKWLDETDGNELPS